MTAFLNTLSGPDVFLLFAIITTGALLLVGAVLNHLPAIIRKLFKPRNPEDWT